MFTSNLSLAGIYPEFEISLNNLRNQNLENDLQSVTVTEDLEAPSMVELQLSNDDVFTDQFTWSDNSQLNPGNEIAIKMGYAGQPLDTVMVGEITGLEPEFSVQQGSTLIVRGHDRRHRLLRGTHTHSFVNLKDSQIAQQIASQNGLAAKVTDTMVKLTYVLQNNQSDLAFLQARSRRIGYDVWIDDKTLHFQPPQHRTLSTVQLDGQNLIEFLPRLSLLNQVPQLEIRGWNWKEQKNFVSQSATVNIPLMDGTQIGAQASKSAFGTASHQIVNQPAQDKAEADQMAKGQFEDISLNYITGEGVCIGNSKIRAGSVIQIVGVGKRFSGRYYVTAVTHLLSADQGYRTEFTVRRTAA